jgi:Pyridoxamine 5'-phosphate oxidase
VFGGAGWDAERVVEFINTVKTITVCTVSAGGDPHAAFVIVGCIDSGIHFTVSDGSLLRRNLACSGRVAFTVNDRDHAVIGRGEAVLVARSLEAPDLVAGLARVADNGTFTPAGWDGAIWRIAVDRIFAS